MQMAFGEYQSFLLTSENKLYGCGENTHNMIKD
jgi:alpha-tubulin suppressor-like RCC1 family protein